MRIGYLEIVTPDVDGVCATSDAAYTVRFGAPVPSLGNARTTQLPDGGTVGIRPPLRDDESPVVRPYALVDDIENAIRAAQKAGAVIALPPMQLPGHGVCAIYLQGGIEHGVWQNG